MIGRCYSILSRPLGAFYRCKCSQFALLSRLLIPLRLLHNNFKARPSTTAAYSYDRIHQRVNPWSFEQDAIYLPTRLKQALLNVHRA